MVELLSCSLSQFSWLHKPLSSLPTTRSLKQRFSQDARFERLEKRPGIDSSEARGEISQDARFEMLVVQKTQTLHLEKAPLFTGQLHQATFYAVHLVFCMLGLVDFRFGCESSFAFLKTPGLIFSGCKKTQIWRPETHPSVRVLPQVTFHLRLQFCYFRRPRFCFQVENCKFDPTTYELLQFSQHQGN